MARRGCDNSNTNAIFQHQKKDHDHKDRDILHRHFAHDVGVRPHDPEYNVKHVTRKRK